MAGFGGASHPDLLMQRANQALASGQFQRCADLTDLLLAQMPNHPAVLVLRGTASFRMERFRDAATFFEKAVKSDPRSGPPHHWLSMALLHAGDHSKAIIHAEKAVQLAPTDLVAQHHLAQCLFAGGNAAQSWSILERILPHAPQVFIVHHTAGLVLDRLGRRDEAIREFKRAQKIDPDHLANLVALREAYYANQSWSEAETLATRLIEIQPEVVDHRLAMARILIDRGVPAKAENVLAKALEMSPQSADALLLMGSISQMTGSIAQAIDWFQKSLIVQPNQGAAYLGIATSQRVQESDREWVHEMVKLAEDSRLDSTSQTQLHFALGKAFEDLSEYPSAMTHYDHGNRLARLSAGAHGQSEEEVAEKRIQTIIQTFNRELMSDAKLFGSQSEVPIFVVGMIRSGTTLVEQILSSHSQVGGAGEQIYWLNQASAFLTAHERIDTALLKPFADRYVRQLQQICPDSKRIVDKMPINYEIIGLLALALPNAKFIHIRRDPVDTCISIYATYNRARMAWIHDKSSLVHHYRLYEKVMEHWRSVLPNDRMLEVDYEALVSDPETQTRQMIQHCGLNWEAACLRPHENVRPVATPSVWQVRQPIYRTSVARRDRFAGLLGVLEDLTKK